MREQIHGSGGERFAARSALFTQRGCSLDPFGLSLVDFLLEFIESLASVLESLELITQRVEVIGQRFGLDTMFARQRVGGIEALLDFLQLLRVEFDAVQITP